MSLQTSLLIFAIGAAIAVYLIAALVRERRANEDDEEA